MTTLYANPVLGMAGLLLFISLFAVVLAWLYWPGGKKKFQNYGDIPLKDDEHE